MTENRVIGYLDDFGNVYEEEFAQEQADLIGAKSISELGFRKVEASDYYQAELDDDSIDNQPPTIYRYLD